LDAAARKWQCQIFSGLFCYVAGDTSPFSVWFAVAFSGGYRLQHSAFGMENTRAGIRKVRESD